jgi:hypothetical protein
VIVPGNKVASWNSQLNGTLAATNAAEVFLPQVKDSRVTFGASTVGSSVGVGIGYARMIDTETRTAFTLSLGTSGGKSVAKASVGFEF